MAERNRDGKGGLPGGLIEVFEDADGCRHSHLREGAQARRELANDCGFGVREGLEQEQECGDRRSFSRVDGGPADGEVGGVLGGLKSWHGGRFGWLFRDFRREGRGCTIFGFDRRSGVVVGK